MRILGINAPAGCADDGELGIAAISGRERDFRSSFYQALNYCKLCGATRIHVLAGNVDSSGCEEAVSVLLQNLKFAAPLAARHGLTVLLEPLNPYDHPNYLYSDASQVSRLINEIGAPNVKLQFDCYHIARSLEYAASRNNVHSCDTHERVLRQLECMLPLIGNVQIAAVESRMEPDAGTVRYDEVFKKLEAAQYDGWIGCEYRPRSDTDAGLKWMSALGVRLK